MSVLAFADADCLRVEQAGGKGASLARMASLGLPVPPGFVVPAGALSQALPDGGAGVREVLAAAAPDGLAEAARRCQDAVASCDAGAALGTAVQREYARLADDLGDADPPVAVRSSACAEDSEAASFAGQQETYLHVRGADSVIDHVRHCWGSFFSERALFYRRQKGSLDDLGMAVVVQRMVQADVAGVLFTMDAVQGRRDRMVVEAVFGLGEAVVSGNVTPDHYVLKRDGRVRRQKIVRQPFAVVARPEGGVQERELSPEEGERPTLDEDQLRELARVGADLEDRLGRPQDIEWALQDGRLYVLQARPVTT
ncbi:MAG TPA: PEP/pyruvate-binding domain-containing protein [Solirubrobacteraceae bacterium]|nr:PEP/pyruvate-binding domain-containing protein [Solirubrobacteraceae bacterium]